MHRYIALLRGVNVGGHNVLSMPLLRAAYEEAGLSKLHSYINSGNILLASAEADVLALQQKCREIIRKKFDLDIPVALISAAELAEALARAPVWWDADADAKHNALFLMAPLRAEAVIDAASAAKPAYERLACHGRVIFWSAPIQTFSHARWSEIVSTTTRESITIRSANTVKKLLMLAQEEPQ